MLALARVLHLTIRSVAAAALFGSAAHAALPPSAPPTDAWTLFGRFRTTHAIALDASSEWDAARAVLAGRLAGGDRDLLPSGEFDSDALRIVALLARAGAASNAAERVGVELLAGGGFAFGGDEFSEVGDAIVLTAEDPENSGAPMTLIVGNSAAFLGELIASVTPTWRPGYTLFRENELARRGALRPDGSANSSTFEVFGGGTRSNLRRHSADGPALFLSRDFTGEETAGAIAEYSDSIALALERVRSWCGDGPQPLVCAYGLTESFYRAQGAIVPSAIAGSRRRVSTILLPGLFDDGGAGAATAFAVSALGEPRFEWCREAAGVEASDRWWGRPLEEWGGHLRNAGLGLELSALLDSESEHSPHQVVPQRALLIRFLRANRGAESVRELWTGKADWTGDQATETAFGEWLAELANRHAGGLASERAARSEAFRARLRRGIALVPGESGIEYGISSQAARESLARARAVGANAVAIDVYAYDAHEEPRYAVACERPMSSVSDVELAVAVRSAAAQGMPALLKPHLLTSESGTLLGQTVLSSPEGWDAFFARYERFLVHYALLAELSGAELLCIGTALPRTTHTKGVLEEEELLPRERRLAGWERMCSTARSAFTGGLTYAALDGAPGQALEAQNIEFWERVDFLGVELFGPLIFSDPTVREAVTSGHLSDERIMVGIRARLARASRIGRELGRPVLFTSVGYPSTRHGVTHPGSVLGELDLEQQRRAYAAFGAAMKQVVRGKDPIGGFYLFNWSANPNGGGPGDRTHTPQNKPAERVLEQVLR